MPLNLVPEALQGRRVTSESPRCCNAGFDLRQDGLLCGEFVKEASLLDFGFDDTISTV